MEKGRLSCSWAKPEKRLRGLPAIMKPPRRLAAAGAYWPTALGQALKQPVQGLLVTFDSAQQRFLSLLYVHSQPLSLPPCLLPFRCEVKVPLTAWHLTQLGVTLPWQWSAPRSQLSAAWLAAPGQ